MFELLSFLVVSEKKKFLFEKKNNIDRKVTISTAHSKDRKIETDKKKIMCRKIKSCGINGLDIRIKII